MRIRVLGSAAGGGSPQWNCDCPVCRAVREDGGATARRTQSSIAVSGDGSRWVLVNASPDVLTQIEATPELRPRDGRTSPVEAVLLTDGELDHTLGLLLLREGRGVRVHSTAAVRDVLLDGTALLRTLRAYCPVEWSEVVPGVDVALGGGLRYRAFDVPTDKPPRFGPAGVAGRVVGYRLTDERTGRTAVYLPGVQELTPGVCAHLAGCACLLVDGTCWSDDELVRLGTARGTSRSMGHQPVDGPDGTAMRLAGLPIQRRIYVHMNNTNPVLLDGSPERRAVERQGFEVAVDGMELRV